MSNNDRGDEVEAVFRIDLRTAEPAEGFTGGKFANHVTIGATENMFMLDFLRVAPIPSSEGLVPKTTLVERIWLSPHTMKGLVDAIQNNIKGYEERWGIELPNLKRLRTEREGG